MVLPISQIKSSRPITVAEMMSSVTMAQLRVPFVLPAYNNTTFFLKNKAQVEFENVPCDTGYTNCVDSVTMVSDGAFSLRTIPTLAVLSCHELLHIGLGHRSRGEALRQIYKAKNDRVNENLMNIAMDMEINGFLKDAFPITVAQHFALRDEKKLIIDIADQIAKEEASKHDPQAAADMKADRVQAEIDSHNPNIPMIMWIDESRTAFETIYNRLHSKLPNQTSAFAQGDESGGGSCVGIGLEIISIGADAKGPGMPGGEALDKSQSETGPNSDEGDGSGDGSGDGNSKTRLEALVAAEARAILRSTIEAMKQAEARGKMKGIGSSDLFRQITEFAYPPASAVDKLTDIVARMIPADDTTRKKLAKGPLLNFNMMAPGRDEIPEITLVHAIDTSGSVGQDDLKTAAGDLQTVCEMLNINDITILFVDAEVTSVQRFNSPSEIVPGNIQPTGGGGTTFVPAFEWVDEQVKIGAMDPPDVFLYTTDLMGTFPDYTHLGEFGMTQIVWCLMEGAVQDHPEWVDFQNTHPDEAEFVDYYPDKK